jgi:tRNA (guanine37-N1)-methyltransferase
VEALRAGPKRTILLSPAGRRLDQALVRELAAESWLVLICGRYEGVDERVVTGLPAEEVSIGDFVMAGGEAAALVLLEAVSRLVPGVVGNEESLSSESFEDGLLDSPHYTRPREFRGMSVPDVLLSGDHGKVAEWRRRAAAEKTRRNRPDLLRDERRGP